MRNYTYKDLPKIPKLKLAVIGHVEWVNFFKVDKLPKEGIISHANDSLEEPAGGGAVAAVQMARLIRQPVHFITALGEDKIGEKCAERLSELGLNLSIAWRKEKTRKAISLITKHGERAITVIGKRLQPSSSDKLPWKELADYDGIFITAADSLVIKYARNAKVLTVTPRIGKEIIQKASTKIDALIGSGLDPDERVNPNEIIPRPNFYISTEGENGGRVDPGGHFLSVKPSSKKIDTYGCGDSFAGAITTALASNRDIEQAISLGAYCGAECLTHYGPY